MATPANSINVTTAGLVKFATPGTFSAVTTTQYNTLVGSTNNGITNITPGTAGHVLTSNGASADPSYQASTGVTGPGSSTDRAIATWNGTGGTALFNNSTITIDSTGRLRNTAQPAFAAYLTASATNVTGDGTLYTIVWDTEALDQGGNFNTTTGIFTAPIAGIYKFAFNISLNDIEAAHTFGEIAIITSGASYFMTKGNFGAMRETSSGNNSMTVSGSILVSMAATNTAYTTVQVSNGTKAVDVVGAIGRSDFTGIMIC